MRNRLPALSAVILIVCLSEAPTSSAYWRARTYSNPYTGRSGYSYHTYNPYTGANRSGRSGYNSFTGRNYGTRTVSNPYTGNAAHVSGAYNPYTNRYAYHYSYRY